jgi:hypothetical protein
VPDLLDLEEVFPGTADAPLPDCHYCRLYPDTGDPHGPAHVWVPALSDDRWEPTDA